MFIKTVNRKVSVFSWAHLCCPCWPGTPVHTKRRQTEYWVQDFFVLSKQEPTQLFWTRSLHAAQVVELLDQIDPDSVSRVASWVYKCTATYDSFFFFLMIESHSVVLVGLELDMNTRLAWNLDVPYLCLLNAGSRRIHAQSSFLIFFFSSIGDFIES